MGEGMKGCTQGRLEPQPVVTFPFCCVIINRIFGGPTHGFKSAEDGKRTASKKECNFSQNKGSRMTEKETLHK